MIIDFRVRLPLKEQFPNADPNDLSFVPQYMSHYLELYQAGLKIQVGVEELLASMEENGIELSVVQAEWEFGDYRALNDAVFSLMNRYPKKIIGFCTVHPEGRAHGVHSYKRGKVTKVVPEVAQYLFSTGDFGPAVVPPPDPNAEHRARAEALVSELASMPELLNTLAEFMADAKKNPVALASLVSPSAKVVTNTMPRVEPAEIDPARFADPRPAAAANPPPPVEEEPLPGPSLDGPDPLRQRFAKLTVTELKELAAAQDPPLSLSGLTRKDDIIDRLIGNEIPPPV